MGTPQTCVPMVLYYYAIQKDQETGYSYVTSYDANDAVYRASVPGSYGKDNCPAGKSYVCCEVPVNSDDALWQSPEASASRIWQEAVRFGVVRGEPQDSLIKRARVSYKAPLKTFWSESHPVRAAIDACPRIVVSDEWRFSIRRTIQHLTELLESAESG
jgi:hypothetical protein